MHDACLHTPLAADVSAIHSAASLTQLCVYSGGPGRRAAKCAACTVRQACGIQLSSHYSHTAFMMSGTLDGLLSAERETAQLQAELESRLWTRRWKICRLVKS